MDVSVFVETLVAGPSRTYTPVTILEGRSVYDIDHALTAKKYITAGEYVAAAHDIARFASLDYGISLEHQFW